MDVIPHRGGHVSDVTVRGRRRDRNVSGDPVAGSVEMYVDAHRPEARVLESMLGVQVRADQPAAAGQAQKGGDHSDREYG